MSMSHFLFQYGSRRSLKQRVWRAKRTDVLSQRWEITTPEQTTRCTVESITIKWSGLQPKRQNQGWGIAFCTVPGVCLGLHFTNPSAVQTAWPEYDYECQDAGRIRIERVSEIRHACMYLKCHPLIWIGIAYSCRTRNNPQQESVNAKGLQILLFSCEKTPYKNIMQLENFFWLRSEI